MRYLMTTFGDGSTPTVTDGPFAEELAQDALVAALSQWPAEGVPDSPGAWLTAVAKRRAIDRPRQAQRVDLSNERAAEPDDVLRLILPPGAAHPGLGRAHPAPARRADRGGDRRAFLVTEQVIRRPSASTRCSSVREVMDSWVNTLCCSTVRELTASAVAISGLERPSRASDAIRTSCGVRWKRVSGIRPPHPLSGGEQLPHRAAGATQEFTRHVANAGMQFSVGAYPHLFDIETVLHRIPRKEAWTPVYDADGNLRDGAWVVEVTDLADLSAWPSGTRLVLRKERPHPGAQLRFTDVDGLRVTGLLTNNSPTSNYGTAATPASRTASALAQDLLAWTQRIGLTGEHRMAEPKRLRLRIFSVAGYLTRTSRQHWLKITNHPPPQRSIRHALNPNPTHQDHERWT